MQKEPSDHAKDCTKHTPTCCDAADALSFVGYIKEYAEKLRVELGPLASFENDSKTEECLDAIDHCCKAIVECLTPLDRSLISFDDPVIYHQRVRRVRRVQRNNEDNQARQR